MNKVGFCLITKICFKCGKIYKTNLHSHSSVCEDCIALENEEKYKKFIASFENLTTEEKIEKILRLLFENGVVNSKCRN